MSKYFFGIHILAILFCRITIVNLKGCNINYKGIYQFIGDTNQQVSPLPSYQKVILNDDDNLCETNGCKPQGDLMEVSISIDRSKYNSENYYESRAEGIIYLETKNSKQKRKRIHNTLEWPNCIHGHIVSKFRSKNSEKYFVQHGSGVLISPSHVLTVGHNLYLHEFIDDSIIYTINDWAYEVEFYAAQNEYKCSGQSKAIVLFSTEYWLKNNNKEHDIGIITLKEPIGYNTGWGSLYCASDNELHEAFKVKVIGYPSDKESLCIQMWYGKGLIKSFLSETLNHDVKYF